MSQIRRRSADAFCGFLALALALSVLRLPAFALADAKVSPSASGVRIELFFEAMDGQGWNDFFLADAVRRRIGGPAVKIYPLVYKSDAGKFQAARGEAELAESMRLAVIGSEYPDMLLTYLNARSLSPWADGWREAAIFCGIDPLELSKKTETLGEKALLSVYDRAQKAGVKTTSLLLNGKVYSGPKRLLPLLEAVNAALPAWAFREVQLRLAFALSVNRARAKSTSPSANPTASELPPFIPANAVTPATPTVIKSTSIWVVSDSVTVALDFSNAKAPLTLKKLNTLISTFPDALMISPSVPSMTSVRLLSGPVVTSSGWAK